MQNRVLLVDDDDQLRERVARLQALLRRIAWDLMQWALGRRLEAYDRTLDMHISNLRKKLGNRIETVRGLGYSFWVPA